MNCNSPSTNCAVKAGVRGRTASRLPICALAAAALWLLSACVIPARVENVGPRSDENGAREEREEDFDEGEAAQEATSVAHRVLFYIPNRILDIFDPFRFRVRVGPGLAAGVRATEVADAFLGGYSSVYAGLPGPRGGKIPKLPVGLETDTGIEVSVIDATTGNLVGPFGPGYSPAEFGASLHVFVVGLDVGFDPVEFLDAFVGFAGVDLTDDDL